MRFYMVQSIDGRFWLGCLETLTDRYRLLPLAPQANAHDVARAMLRELGADETESTVRQLTAAFLSQLETTSVFVPESAVRHWLTTTRSQPAPAPDPPGA